MKHDFERTGAEVIGTHVDAIDWADCLERIRVWAAHGESRAVVHCNVHSLVTARHEPTFARAVRAADLVTPDGAPVAWCLRRLGFGGQERISGPDLMWKCCELCAYERLPVFLYGGSRETLGRLRLRLSREFPGLPLAGWHSPPFRSMSETENTLAADAIGRSGARVVFVGLGCPKQEQWIAAQRGRISGVMLGVGAAFDFHAGVTPRAPHWMRARGLEWLHRLLQEPRRLGRRYLVTNTLFMAYLAEESLRRQRRKTRSRKS